MIDFENNHKLYKIVLRNGDIIVLITKKKTSEVIDEYEGRYQSVLHMGAILDEDEMKKADEFRRNLFKYRQD